MQKVAQVAVCSQKNTKHINTMWAQRSVKLVVHHESGTTFFEMWKWARGFQHFYNNI